VISPEPAQNGLESCLGDLERLGLVRPAHILFTEYLAALAAESVVDADTATRVAATYHRLRYGTVDPDDLEMRDAIERLRATAAAVAAMSEKARQGLAGRLRLRLQTSSAPEPQPPSADSDLPDPGARLEWNSIGVTNMSAGDYLNGDAVPRLVSTLPAASNAAKQRGFRINSLPLETATLLVVGLIVAGYLLRGGADQSVATSSGEATKSKSPKVFAQDVWRHDDYWADNLLRRAQADASQKREQSARLAFELYISDVPRNATGLNDLAWLYLTSDDLSVRNPSRALELASRALAIRRTPEVLDTAAEARYQTGQAEEAVRLEREALDRPRSPTHFEDPKFREVLERQFEKFQNAANSAGTGVQPASAP
jgi:hypothetical protein